MVVPKARADIRIGTRNRKHAPTTSTVNETWKLGKQLSRPLIGRTSSISLSLTLSESSIASVTGDDQRSGTGKKMKNGRLTR